MNEKEIDEALKDYSWMIKSVKKMRDEESVKNGIITQYKEESPLSYQESSSDTIQREMTRYDKRWERIHKYEEKIKMIQDRVHLIGDDRESEVLYWILEGKSLGWISRHMGLSATHIHRIKNKIVQKLAVKSEVGV